MRCIVSARLRWLLTIGVVVFAVRDAPAAIVDFDDLSSAPESYWNGPDPNGTDVMDPYGGIIRMGSFPSGNVEFVNRYNLTYRSWSGFAYSNTTDATTAGYTNQFSACTGSGYGPGDDNYGVAYGYRDVLDPGDASQLQQLPYFELPEGARIENAYITNTTYAVLSMLHGDQFAKQFGGADGSDPDWFKLTVYGTDASGIPLLETVEFYLADYRFSDNDLDYIVDQWTLMDLSPLADAERLYFNPSSSDVDPSWGMNTPGYFAIDNVGFAPSTAVLLGDVNLDGTVNGLDVDPFVDVLLSGPYQPEADMNEDQVVNGLDVDLFVAAVVTFGGVPSVPEPSSLVLFGLGLVALAVVGRRRRLPH